MQPSVVCKISRLRSPTCSRTVTSIMCGVVAGTLGLTSLHGFAVYILGSFLLSVRFVRFPWLRVYGVQPLLFVTVGPPGNALSVSWGHAGCCVQVLQRAVARRVCRRAFHVCVVLDAAFRHGASVLGSRAYTPIHSFVLVCIESDCMVPAIQDTTTLPQGSLARTLKKWYTSSSSYMAT